MNKLYRSRRDSKLTGLCGGIGEWLAIDATVVRLLLILAACFTGGGVLLVYFIASLIVPKAPYDGLSFGSPYHYN